MTAPIRRIKHVASIRVSNVDKKSIEGQPRVRLCNYTDVYYRDSIRSSQDFMDATATPEQIEAFRLEPGDVVITKDSETPDDIGIPSLVVDSAPDLVCGYHLAILRPDARILDAGYLYWSMRGQWMRQQFAARATGVTRFGLRLDVVGDARLFVPTLAEQERIREELDAERARVQQLMIGLRGQIELFEERLEAFATTQVAGPDSELAQFLVR